MDMLWHREAIEAGVKITIPRMGKNVKKLICYVRRRIFSCFDLRQAGTKRSLLARASSWLN